MPPFVLSEIRRLLSSAKGHDEPLFDLVARELESGIINPGLWAKALAQSDFDEARAKGWYVRERVAHLQRAIPSLRNMLQRAETLESERESLEASIKSATERLSAIMRISATYSDSANSLRSQLESRPIADALASAENHLQRTKIIGAAIGGAFGLLVSILKTMSPEKIMVSTLCFAVLGGFSGWAVARVHLRLAPRPSHNAREVQSQLLDSESQLAEFRSEYSLVSRELVDLSTKLSDLKRRQQLSEQEIGGLFGL